MLWLLLPEHLPGVPAKHLQLVVAMKVYKTVTHKSCVGLGGAIMHSSVAIQQVNLWFIIA